MFFIRYNTDAMSKYAAYSSSSAQAHSSSTPPFELLLVEDDEVSRLYLRTLLSSLGYRVTCAESGETALRHWEKHYYGAILLDIQLPEMSGLDVAARIRSLEYENKRERVPIIALTAYSSEEDRRKIEEVGMDQYLTKPTDATALEQVLDSIRASKSAGPPTGDASEENHNESGRLTQKSASDEQPAASPEEYARRLQKEFEGAEDTLSQMVEMSLEEIPAQLQHIERCIDEERGDAGTRHAHSLANVAGILFAADIREKTLKLEKLLRSADFTSARSRYEHVAASCSPLLEALRSLQKT